MDLISKNPGLQHISEEIFLNLDNENLLKCQKVNKNWEQIINNPTFWLKKCLQHDLTEEDHEDWSKLIKTLKSDDDILKQSVTTCLKYIHDRDGRIFYLKWKHPLYVYIAYEYLYEESVVKKHGKSKPQKKCIFEKPQKNVHFNL